jgi:anti-sigma regulatory factor (Ser/Thr protein kinase)
MMADMIKIIFPISMVSVRLADDIFDAIARNVTVDTKLAFNIRLVLSEVFSNAFLYGEKQSAGAVIEFRGCFNNHKFVASIINEGTGFSDNAIEWNKFPKAMEESGRGLKIIRQLCDKLEFRKHNENKFETYVEINTGIKVNKD